MSVFSLLFGSFLTFWKSLYLCKIPYFLIFSLLMGFIPETDRVRSAVRRAHPGGFGASWRASTSRRSSSASSLRRVTMPTLSTPMSLMASRVVATLQKSMWVRGSLNLHSMANCMSGAEAATSCTAGIAALYSSMQSRRRVGSGFVRPPLRYLRL